MVACREWGARPPRHPNLLTNRPVRIVVHHTAGRAPETAGSRTSFAAAAAYARELQLFHMEVRGWNDSGHNFLVTAGGYVLEGRQGSLAAIEAGRMIVSAHCPGQNDQPGVEHEHSGTGPLRDAQKAASVWLHALVCRRAGIEPVALHPHSAFFDTDCPTGPVVAWLPDLRRRVAWELEQGSFPPEFWLWARWWLGRGEFAQFGPRNRRVRPRVPRRVPRRWWHRLETLVGAPSGVDGRAEMREGCSSIRGERRTSDGQKDDAGLGSVG